MTLYTNLGIPVSVNTIYTTPVPGMGVFPPGLMALDADISVRVAGLAGLQIPARLGCMVCGKDVVALIIRAERPVGLDPQVTAGEFGVAFVAVPLVVATSATLGIIH